MDTLRLFVIYVCVINKNKIAMKLKFLGVLLFLFNLVTYSQITLENTINSQYLENSGFIELENSGTKYYVHERNNWTVTIYNLDHSVFNTIQIDKDDIDVTNFPNFDAGSVVYCLSENLFDLDSGIEFLIHFEVYSNDWNTSISKTVVIDDDGSVLFEEIDQSPPTFEDVVYQQFPNWIKNTPDGTKMLLRSNDGNNLYVYSLPGTVLSTSKNGNNKISLNAYPNPSNSYTTIEYKLPFGVRTGNIVFYDISGKEVKRFNVEERFENIKISTSELKQGVYLYNLQAGNFKSEGKRLVVIN